MEPRVRMLRAVAAAPLMSTLRVWMTIPAARPEAATMPAGVRPAARVTPPMGVGLRSMLILACRC
jgi:hypothetical protein